MKVRRVEAVFELLRIAAAFLIAYGLTLLVLVLISGDPAKAIYSFTAGPFTTARRFGNIIQKMVPLVFTGLGMCFMYSVNRFNVSGEGIFITSACITTFFALLIEGLGMPGWLKMAVLLAVGGVIGAIAASIPAVINAKLGANIIVLSIMLNYILLYFTQFILTRVVRDVNVSYTASYEIPADVRFDEWIPRTGIHTGIFAAIFFVIVVVILFHKTSLGFEMRTVGSNPEFAVQIGMNTAAAIIIAQMLGGALAGVGGSLEQLAMNSRFQWTALTNHGMNGVIVAVLAKKKPQYIPLTAFLMAYIQQGAQIVNSSTDVPAEFVVVVQGVVVLMIAAEMFLSKTRNKIIYSMALQDSRNRENKREESGSR